LKGFRELGGGFSVGAHNDHKKKARSKKKRRVKIKGKLPVRGKKGYTGEERNLG